jgi:hypothetical protein
MAAGDQKAGGVRSSKVGQAELNPIRWQLMRIRGSKNLIADDLCGDNLADDVTVEMKMQVSVGASKPYFRTPSRTRGRASDGYRDMAYSFGCGSGACAAPDPSVSTPNVRSSGGQCARTLRGLGRWSMRAQRGMVAGCTLQRREGRTGW